MKPIDKIKANYVKKAKKAKKAEEAKIPEFNGSINSALYSYHYAISVLNGRFELGEKAISKNAYHSYLYARNILKGRFELGEKAISKSAGYSYLYARDILKLK